MLHFFSEQIFIRQHGCAAAQHKLSKLAKKMPQQGNSAILDILLPELSGWRATDLKPAQMLNKIDHYMQQETTRFLKRLTQYYGEVNNLTSLDVKLAWQAGKFSSQMQDANHAVLLQDLNKDKWLKDIVQWLQPNYLALAESQAFLEFSYVYESNRALGKHLYEHFQDKSQSLHSYIQITKDPSNMTLIWYVESRLVRYQVAVYSFYND